MKLNFYSLIMGRLCLFGGLILLFSTSFAHADTETGKVKLIVATGTMVRVFNANNLPNLGVPGSGAGSARCTGTGIFGGMDLQLTNEGAKAMYSKLLAAEAAGQNVVFWYTLSPSNYTCTLDIVSTP